MSSTPHRRLRAAARGVAAAALLAAVLPAAASAHIPAIGNGLQPTTDGPDLRSATIVNSTKDSVRFCFDAAVTKGDAGAFLVRPYDSGKYWVGQSVEADATNGACLNVRFSGDVSQGSIGEVTNPIAATALNGFGPAPASEALGGSAISAAAGRTSGPDLVRVEKISGTQLVFHFDEPIVNFAANDAGVMSGLLIEREPQPKPGQYVAATAAERIDAGDRNTIRATFPEGTLSSSIMAAVSGGIVSDVAGQYGGGTVNPTYEMEIEGRSTAAISSGIIPTAVRFVGSRQLEISFGGRAVSIYAPNIAVYSETGTAAVPVETTLNSAHTALLANFDEGFGRQSGSWVSVFVGTNTVSDNGAVNAGRSLNLATANSVPGYTSGPDLLSATLDASQNITYRFDEPVASPAPAVGSQLLNILPSSAFGFAGSQAGEAPISDVGGSTVTVHHRATAAASVAAGIMGFSPAAPNAVYDAGGVSPAPSGSVSYQTYQPAPVAAAPIAAPVVPALSAATTSLKRVKLKKTKKTKKKKAQVYAVKYNGRLSSTNPVCIAKRSVRVYVTAKKGKRAKFIGKAKSNSRGAWAVKVKVRPKGKITASSVELPGQCAGVGAGPIKA